MPMPVITRLETQKHNPERVNIHLDDAFAFGASAMVVLTRGLAPGMELSTTEIAELRVDEEAERAYGAALNFLSYRPRSTREVEDYFRRRKLEPELVPAVVERLVRAGLLDDQEFARFWVENRQTFRPKGARALSGELRQKGLSREVIEGALEELGDEEETAILAGRRKAQGLRHLDEREFFRRMIGFMQRRGFTYETAAAATRRLAIENDLPDEDRDEPG